MTGPSEIKNATSNVSQTWGKKLVGQKWQDRRTIHLSSQTILLARALKSAMGGVTTFL